VGTARAAAEHIDTLLGDELADVAETPDALVIDFGCGVGGTLVRLAERFPRACFRGITISPRQVQVAARLAARRGLAARCAFTHGDFHSAHLGARACAVVAVEAFAHSTSVAAFLANVVRHLEQGGRLLLVDDFLSSDERTLAPSQRRRVEELRAGWRVPAIGTVQRLAREAAEHGLALEKDIDLTPLTRPGARLRDRAVAALAPSLTGLDLARFPIFGNMIGGHALQVGLRDGFIHYRLLVFRNVA
jgi:SAM-dependent methyltransferase